jgi:hypothetical protein
MTLEAALRARLTAVTEVTDILGTRIYPVGTPLGPTLPYLHYSIDEAEATLALDGICPLKRYVVGIQFWCADYDQAKALDAAVFSALSDYRSGATQRIGFVTRTDVDEEDGRFEASHSYSAWFLNSEG